MKKNSGTKKSVDPGQARKDPAFASARRDRSWLWTSLLALVLIGGALLWRVLDGSNPSLPRTRALIAQKIQSLQDYNQAMSEAELIRFFETHIDRTVQPEAMAAISELVTHQIVPRLWSESQQLNPDERFVSHAAMVKTIHKYFPQDLLANGDIVLFPNDPELRVIVSEPVQDFLRDSGWHWRWMGQYVEGLGGYFTTAAHELDLYAAEELSELLSVIGVGWVMLAARHLEATESPIDAESIRSTFKEFWERPRTTLAYQEEKSSFSEDTKKRILEALPDPMFQEITAKMKLDFVHRQNQQLRNLRGALEVPVGIAGGGVSAGDYDGDGDVDLFFAGDRGGRLYKNIRNRQFRDVTLASGLHTQGETRAGYFVDYDNDGDQDLFVTFVWQTNRLYRNEGPGVDRFTDVTRKSGLVHSERVSHGAVWFDMDNDGLLDLYVANFGPWPAGTSPTIGRDNTTGAPNSLYHHRVKDGRHYFVEVGEALGLADRGWTHCVGAWDFDQDGYLDLFVANDFGASRVFRNIQGQRFVEASRELHLDTTYNAMNFTLVDLDHSGHPAIYVTEIFTLAHRQRYRRPTEETPIVFNRENLKGLRILASNQLYRQRAEGTYENVHETRTEPTDHGWAWDASTLDYENDGDLDLLVLNGTETKVPMLRNEKRKGHLIGRVYVHQFGEAQNLFFCSEDGYYYDVSSACPLAFRGNSRGSAFFDLDGDGDLDIAINNYDGAANLFENTQKSNNTWIRFQLEGTQSNRNAIGARVEIRFGDQVRYDQVVCGSGFLSQNPMALHFGLGQAKVVDQATVTWPSGLTQRLENLAANETHHILEPQGE